MKDTIDISLFGYASKCKSVEDTIEVLEEVTGDEAGNATVAFGMLLAALSAKSGNYRDDALGVLDKLANAKAQLDSTSAHTFPTIDVTHDILHSAQSYAYENTIPCTEWPTSEEIVNIVFETAKKYAKVSQWKRHIKNETGAIIGTEEIKNV